MHSRCLIIASAALVFAGAAAAEPAKPAQQAAAQPERPATVVLASADQIRTPSAVAQAQLSPAKKPRAARVTTCRCAGQTAQTDQ